MAAEIKDATGIDPQLIESSGGVFEIEYNGKLVFSKKQLDRFPEDGEILGLIQQTPVATPKTPTAKL